VYVSIGELIFILYSCSIKNLSLCMYVLSLSKHDYGNMWYFSSYCAHVHYNPYFRQLHTSTIFDHVTIEVPHYYMIAFASNIDGLSEFAFAFSAYFAFAKCILFVHTCRGVHFILFSFSSRHSFHKVLLALCFRSMTDCCP
jgi:hypothetical protein